MRSAARCVNRSAVGTRQVVFNSTRLGVSGEMATVDAVINRSAFCGLLFFGLFAGWSAGAQAEIYKYEDRFGNVYFTDEPMKGRGVRLTWRASDDPWYRQFTRIDLDAYAKNRKRLTPLINAVAREAGLPSALLHAVVQAESAYDPHALSKKGARGLMQLMPKTAEAYGVSDSWDPKQNLTGGARYLNQLIDMFDQDLSLALAAYNAGENAVKRYGNKIPPYPETQTYVERVLDFYEKNSG